MATAEDNLRHQFQLLQDQQQKKLMRRKQRLEEKDKAHTARAHTASVISTSSSAFGVADNLDLKVLSRIWLLQNDMCGSVGNRLEFHN